MSEQSITQWIGGIKSGNQSAAGPLWEAYYRQLVTLARNKLRGSTRRVADEEDVALSAFDSFCRNAAEGRFPRLDDRDDLWKLLFTITERKALRQVQHERRQKRGGGQVKGESVFEHDGSPPGLDQYRVAPEPTPDEAAAIVENVATLLDLLNDCSLRKIAVAKMEGFTNEEIAAQSGMSERSIKRKLRVIRAAWSAEDW